jgi:N-ethylmaleimide reductase
MPSTPTATLFSPFQAGELSLQNRIVMAPLTRSRATGQLPNALMAQYYAQRANPQTGAGLIISEATPVADTGHGYADTPGIHTAEQAKAWAQVTQAVHAQGGKIVCQLWHVGRISHTELQPGGAAPLAPSALRANSRAMLLDAGVPRFEPTSMPRAVTLGEIAQLVQAFTDGAARAMEAGFDGVEIHGANGYLLDQFLRSYSNVREDAYGGTLQRRARFMLEVTEAVCRAVGAGRVGIRLSPVTGPNTPEEVGPESPQTVFDHVAHELGANTATRGMAYVHAIEGATAGARVFAQGGYAFDYAQMRRVYQAAGGRAAWMVNNGYDGPMAHAALDGAGAELAGNQPASAEHAGAELAGTEHAGAELAGTDRAALGGADLVAFGRPFVANPDLGLRLRTGAAWEKGDKTTWYQGGARGYTDQGTSAST